jgi:hypothetical protein
VGAGLRWRRGSTCGQKLPDDWRSSVEYFTEKTSFLFQNWAHGKAAFLWNYDHTGLHLLPSSKTTWAPAGAKEVRCTGLNDKRQITAVLACTLDGDLLPPQLIYQGTGTTNGPFPSSHLAASAQAHEGWFLNEALELLVPNVELLKRSSLLLFCTL